MKNLYDYIKESILDDMETSINNMDSDLKRTMILNWAKENLNRPDDDTEYFELDNNYKIINKPKRNLSFPNKDIDIPEYIKFGDIDENIYFGSETLKKMSQEQLPTCQSTMYLSGKINTIPSFTYTCNSFYINDYPQYLKNIEPITLKMTSKNYRKPTISLDNTKIQLSDLLNIKVEGEVYSLYIKKTPAAEQIKKEIKKLDKKGEKTGECLYQKYLDDLFKNFSGLRFIYLSDRTTLEHNPKTLSWYMF
jgi:hypothetical protein